MAAKTFQVLNPGLGLNNFISDTLIKDTEASDLLNIEFTEAGGAAKRKGSVQIGNETGTRIRGGGSFYKSDGTRETLRVNGTKLEKLVGNSWTEVAGITFTEGPIKIIQARDALYFHNGLDNMWKYDGAVSQPVTGVKAKFGEFYNGYHIVAGNPSFPSRVYISNPSRAEDFTGMSGTATAGSANTLTDSTKSWGVNDFADQTVKIVGGTGAGQSRVIASNTATVLTVATNWATNPDATSQYVIATGNTIDIAKDDGDKVTGIKRYQDKLIITKERATYQLKFDEAGIPILIPIIIGKGCVSAGTMVNVENDLFMFSREGIVVLGNEPNYFDAIRTNTLSARIKPELDIIVASNLEDTNAIYFDNKYLLAVPQGGSEVNNIVIVYDRRYTAFSKWSGIFPNCFWTFIDANNDEHLYFGDDTAGKTWELNQGYADGDNPINAYWVSKNFDLKEFDVKKRFFWMRLLFRRITGTVRVEIIIDGEITVKNITLGSSGSFRGIGHGLISTVLLGRSSTPGAVSSSSQDQTIECRLNKRGRNIKLRVSNNKINESFTLLGFKGRYKTMKVPLPSGSRF